MGILAKLVSERKSEKEVSAFEGEVCRRNDERSMGKIWEATLKTECEEWPSGVRGMCTDRLAEKGDIVVSLNEGSDGRRLRRGTVGNWVLETSIIPG